jgi:hypothetical protein
MAYETYAVVLEQIPGYTMRPTTATGFIPLSVT